MAVAIVALFAITILTLGSAVAVETNAGPSGYPVPRFVSLKSGEVNLREGPSNSYKKLWKYIRKGWPVEVTAESDTWRRIRDVDGVVGWVHKSMLDGQRNVIIRGSSNAALLEQADAGSAVVAYLAPGVVAYLESCHAAWCQIEAQGYGGWIPRVILWGVYPDETIE